MNEEENGVETAFIADYCKRGTTKCQRCKKAIPKGNLRIGKSVFFKTKYIYQYLHVECAFASFEKARLATRVITCMDDIGGFDLLKDDDRLKIIRMMDETNEKRSRPLTHPIKKP